MAIASGVNTVVNTAPGTVINGFEFDVRAAGNPPLFDPVQLATNTVALKPFNALSTGDLDIYVTVQDIALNGIFDFLSNFQVTAGNAGLAHHGKLD